jgi:hypothetical protein
LTSPSAQLTEIGCQPIKGWFNLGRQRLTKDLAMLGFGGAPMACSPALQTGNEVVIKIAHMQISGHLSSMRSLISMISEDRRTVDPRLSRITSFTAKSTVLKDQAVLILP